MKTILQNGILKIFVFMLVLMIIVGCKKHKDINSIKTQSYYEF